MVSTAFFSSRSSAQGHSVVSAEDVDSFWCDLNPEIVTKLDLVCLQLGQDYTQVLSIRCKRHDRDVAERLEELDPPRDVDALCRCELKIGWPNAHDDGLAVRNWRIELGQRQ